MNTMITKIGKLKSSIKLINDACAFAIVSHMDVNQKYDGNHYHFHLKAVSEYALKYSHLIDDDDLPLAIAACWTHDLIEDCRITYNDLLNVTGKAVADVAFALTNEKGKSRKERANDKYYQGIKSTRLALFVKLCDRLANVKHSKDANSRMLDVYRGEHAAFVLSLFSIEYHEMFDELSELLK